MASCCGLSREGELSSEERSLPFADFGELTLTPALADCHCHLLEYAAGSLYPVAEPAHLLAGKALLLNALCSGVTALGNRSAGTRPAISRWGNTARR